MADLKLKGNLLLVGTLKLAGEGGKVKIEGKEALVEGVTGTAVSPVMIPPPPAGPTDPGLDVEVISSFNKTVTAGGKNIVAMGIVMQGNNPTWPGMMLPSSSNTGPVLINGFIANVVGDQAAIFPSGGIGDFSSSSGQ